MVPQTTIYRLLHPLKHWLQHAWVSAVVLRLATTLYDNVIWYVISPLEAYIRTFVDLEWRSDLMVTFARDLNAGWLVVDNMCVLIHSPSWFPPERCTRKEILFDNLIYGSYSYLSDLDLDWNKKIKSHKNQIWFSKSIIHIIFYSSKLFPDYYTGTFTCTRVLIFRRPSKFCFHSKVLYFAHVAWVSQSCHVFSMLVILLYHLSQTLMEISVPPSYNLATRSYCRLVPTFQYYPFLCTMKFWTNAVSFQLPTLIIPPSYFLTIMRPRQ